MKSKQPPNASVDYCGVRRENSLAHTRMMTGRAPRLRALQASGRLSLEPHWRGDNGIDAGKNRPVRHRIAPNAALCIPPEQPALDGQSADRRAVSMGCPPRRPRPLGAAGFLDVPDARTVERLVSGYVQALGRGSARPAILTPSEVAMNGKLIVVGTGMTAISQLTREAEYCLSIAERVFYLVTDAHTEAFIRKLNASAECLTSHYEYGTGKPRLRAYQDMIETILCPVRRGLTVCAAFYGHPGVFVYPSHEAIVRARREGHDAKMLPGISSEDMLIADLGVDPALPGLQTYEATGFLLLKPSIDARIPLILWQVGVVGVLTADSRPSAGNLQALRDALLMSYPADHEVIVYQASGYDNVAPVLSVSALADLPAQEINALSTLYVPPCVPAVPDVSCAARLGIRLTELSSSTHPGSVRIPGQAYGITDPEHPEWVLRPAPPQPELRNTEICSR